MNYGEIKKHDIANGQGIRVSLFVSGCRHHCKNCFNSETWDFSFGREFTKETEEEILKALGPGYISGLTLIGGEPMEIENQRDLLAFVKKVKEAYPNKDIWCYTGFVYEDLLKSGRGRCEATDELLRNIDVLVDGPFIESKKNISLKFRGSENQRIIDLRKTTKDSIVLWEG